MSGTRRTPGRFALGLLIGASALLVWTATAAATPDFTISKTADAEYTVSHTWKVTKTAQPAGPITASGAKADVAYAVAVTRDEVRDWRVTGVITITNTTVFDATNVADHRRHQRRRRLLHRGRVHRLRPGGRRRPARLRVLVRHRPGRRHR